MIHTYYSESFSSRRYFVGTTAAILLSAAALGAGTGISTALSGSASRKADKKAQEASNAAKTTAEQRALQDAQMEQKNSTARASLLAAPTSGFGPNPNLARSFLTTL